KRLSEDSPKIPGCCQPLARSAGGGRNCLPGNQLSVPVVDFLVLGLRAVVLAAGFFAGVLLAGAFLAGAFLAGAFLPALGFTSLLRVSLNLLTLDCSSSSSSSLSKEGMAMLPDIFSR